MRFFRPLSAAILAISLIGAGCGGGETRTISKCIPEGSCGNTVAPSPSAPPKEFPKGDLASGKTLYTRHCQTCHGAGGNGVPGGAMMPQDLSSGVWQQTRSDDQIRSVLARGKNQMPGFGYLSDEDHSSLILFVRSLRVAPPKPGGSGY